MITVGRWPLSQLGDIMQEKRKFLRAFAWSIVIVHVD